jgi:hypothetical protein
MRNDLFYMPQQQDDEETRRAMQALAGADAPAAQQDAPGFRDWFDSTAKQLDLSPNPDDPEAFYNYRAFYDAMKRGEVKPPTEPGGHWDSRFKDPNHPRAFLADPGDGRYFDTTTGNYTGGAKEMVPEARMNQLNGMDVPDLPPAEWKMAQRGMDARPSSSDIIDPWAQAQGDPLAAMGRAQSAPQMSAQELPQKQDGFHARGPSPWAILADLALNKGRGLGPILAASSEQSQREHELAAEYKQAQIDEMRRRHSGGEVDPFKQWYQTEQTRLREEDMLRKQHAGEAAAAKYADAGNPNAEHTRGALTIAGEKAGASTRGRLEAQHDFAPTGAEDAATKARRIAEERQGVKFAGAEQDNALAAERAAAIAEATAPSKVQTATDIAEATAPTKVQVAREQQVAKAQPVLDASGEEILTPQQRMAKENQGYAHAKGFLDKHEKDLDIAALIQDVKGSPEGGASPQFFERFKNTLTQRGIDPKRMEGWQAKQMILEEWSRAQSGAAINSTEDERFARQTGLTPTAPKEQVEAAFNVLDRIERRRIRAAGVSNPAARDVVASYGLNPDEWVGKQASGKRTQSLQESAPATGDVLSVTGQKPGQIPKVSDVLGLEGDDDFSALGMRRIR